MEANCHVEPISKDATADQIRRADHALLSISGMGCQNCVTRVSNGLLSLDGVYGVDVFLNLGLAEVTYNGQAISTNMLVEAVSRSGNDSRHEYHAELVAA